MKRSCLRIEITDCPWTKKLRFQLREGDLSGSTESSNLTKKELENHLLFLVDEWIKELKRKEGGD